MLDMELMVGTLRPRNTKGVRVLPGLIESTGYWDPPVEKLMLTPLLLGTRLKYAESIRRRPMSRVQSLQRPLKWPWEECKCCHIDRNRCIPPGPRQRRVPTDPVSDFELIERRALMSRCMVGQRLNLIKGMKARLTSIFNQRSVVVASLGRVTERFKSLKQPLSKGLRCWSFGGRSFVRMRGSYQLHEGCLELQLCCLRLDAEDFIVCCLAQCCCLLKRAS